MGFVSTHFLAVATARSSALCTAGRQRRPKSWNKPRPYRPVSAGVQMNGVEIHPVPVDVLLVGANSSIGVHVASALHSRGVSFAALHSKHDTSPSPTPLPTPAFTCNIDLSNPTSYTLELASVSPRTILSCIEGDVDDDGRADYIGNKTLIDLAKAMPTIDRFVLVSALGAGDSERTVPFQVMDTMRPLLLDKSRAELYLRESGLPYVIVRPGPLHDGEALGSAVFTESLAGYGAINRADLAELLCEALESRVVLNRTCSAMDKTKVLVTSPYVRPLEFFEPLPFEELVL